MKKAYNAPKLSSLGSVEKVTQAFGTANVNDTVFFNGVPFGNGTTGSVDGNVVASPR